jgi:hypothetical protein
MLQLDMSILYMSCLAYTCEHILFSLALAIFFFICAPIVHDPAGRSSRASISITPSSLGNGSFARHFWYVFITTRGGIEQSIEGRYCQLYFGARWFPLIALILEMLGQDEHYLNCQAWILSLTLFDGMG